MGNTLKIDLFDGEIHKVSDKNPRGYERIIFSEYTMYFKDLNTELGNTKRSYRSDREMNVSQLRERIAETNTEIDESTIEQHDLKAKLADLDKATELVVDTVGYSDRKINLRKEIAAHEARLKTVERTLDRKIHMVNGYKVELQKKFSVPFACIALILVGIPVGVRTRSGGIVMGGTISMAFFLLYY